MKSNVVILAISLVISILTNLCLAFVAGYALLNGWPESRYGKYGRLKKDINLGQIGENKTEVILPKGMIVKDSSASGMDYFEPHRFKLIITSEYPSPLTSPADAIELPTLNVCLLP